MTAMPHRRRPWHRLPRCKDVVTKGPFLCHGSATFVVQRDNNLVLYNKGPGFQFDTHGDGVNCTLSLTDRGQFVITAPTACACGPPRSPTRLRRESTPQSSAPTAK
ncbi:unnamed protein product [Musa banksii]